MAVARFAKGRREEHAAAVAEPRRRAVTIRVGRLGVDEQWLVGRSQDLADADALLRRKKGR
jgi:hypothetical protein